MQNINNVSNSNRALRFEALENRLPLATAAFMVNLYHDDNGVPGAEITNDTVAVGDSFFVEITAQEFAPSFDGMSGVSLDLTWDPTTLREIDPKWDPLDLNSPIITTNLPMFRQGALDNDAGSITNLSGGASVGLRYGRAIGNGIPEQFSLLRFQALSNANVSPLSISQGGAGIATVPVSSLHSKHLYFEPQTITVLPRDEANETLNVSDSIPSAGSPVEATEKVAPDPVTVVEPVPAKPLSTVTGTNSLDSLNFCPRWEDSFAIAEATNTLLPAENTSQHVLTTAPEAESEADLAAANNSLNSANNEQTELASPPIPTTVRHIVETVPIIAVGFTSASSNPSHLAKAMRVSESSESGTLIAMALRPTFGYVLTRHEVNATSNTEYEAVVDDLIANDFFATAKSKSFERLLDLLGLA